MSKFALPKPYRSGYFSSFITISILRKAYKILRNIIVSLLLMAAGLYVLLYAAISLPPVQSYLCRLASKELSEKTGGKIDIGGLGISPFSELELYDVSVLDPKGADVMKAQSVGAGISLGSLLFEGRLVFTYAEVIGLDAHIVQSKPDAPLNIQFLIDAFKSKDKKEPTKYDLVLNNIVLRDCRLTYDKEWQPRSETGKIDFNHIQVTDLAADLRLPVLKNDDIEVDLRRLTFKEASGFTLSKLSGVFHISPDELKAENPVIELPGTHLYPGDIVFPIKGYANLAQQILSRPLTLALDGAVITPSDFACFLPALKTYRQTAWLTVDVTYDSRAGDVHIENFNVNSQPGLVLGLKGNISGLSGDVKKIRADLPLINLTAEGKAINSILTDFIVLPESTASMIRRLGDVKLNASVSGGADKCEFKGTVDVAPGHAYIEADYEKLASNTHSLRAVVRTPSFELGRLLDKDDFGKVIADVEADIVFAGKDISGTADLNVPLFTYKGYPYSNLVAEVSKQDSQFGGEIHMSDSNLDFDIEGSALLAGAQSVFDVKADIRTFNLSKVNLGIPYDDMSLTGSIEASFTGNTLSNANGFINVNLLKYSDAKHPEIEFDRIAIESETGELPYRLRLESDYLDASITGDYDLLSLPASFSSLASHFLPALVSSGGKQSGGKRQDFEFSLLLKKDGGLLEKLKSPIRLFEDLEIEGVYNSETGIAGVGFEIPYMVQGKNKLIKSTSFALSVDTAANKCDVSVRTCLPNNKGDISLMLDANVRDGMVDTDLSWLFDRKSSYKGKVALSTCFEKASENGAMAIDVNVNPSTFEVNDTVWHIDPATIRYADKSLRINGVKVHRPGQYALIEGTATSSPTDSIKVSLNNIDLDYVFETLAINYVTFGGRASGELTASSVFTSTPQLKTDCLKVDNLTYNNCVLGNAMIQSHWDMDRQAVYLDADIKERGRRVARIYGDIFATRDSLSLFCDANKVNVGFLQPFMAAFSSSVEGRASGDVHLYGTFKDIDLTGKVFADSLRMKIDVLNTYYSVSDSVLLTPGLIKIEDVTLRDRDGHTALLNGEVRHEYFHNPSFDFAITGARNFLCYDTNAALNPQWYGTIYGNGSGSMHGVPGFIDIRVDMTTERRSAFTFVLDDTEQAEAYQFLTFTDKRKAALEAVAKQQAVQEDNRPSYLKEFEKKADTQKTDVPTRYAMDIRVTATPEADLTIVMDPIAGDKIRANGDGALRLYYNSDGEMSLYGTYTLSKGLYNFTMQDVIVRDFKIRQGSKITFAGDPLAANLDITAAYRVNTSLTDLDKSFADDRELTRTNVPVEALLKVSGPMQSPDIDFDIELPTLTEDVSRKVKSIISTQDMMNRQIVYLLALNRFYTPDYMGTEGSNNELAAVASTTLSTQLSSMLGELTPGWSFSPYFRTEKGDFSDMEVDLALSSSLLNNRLILNGNLGYRDRATSSTTFIGDFDIEYLLNNAGTLRLKAYNHYNDQNYYLRSALTTQGIGIMFKRDFDHFLPGLFRRLRRKKNNVAPAAIRRKETEPEVEEEK